MARTPKTAKKPPSSRPKKAPAKVKEPVQELEHEQEPSVNPDERRGLPLLAKIREEQDRRGYNLNELATALGFSKPYLTALFAFQRPVDRLNKEYMGNIAKFLRIPKAQVYCLAEILVPEDFVHDYALEEQLAEAFTRMRADPVWMNYAPSDDELAGMPTRLKLGFAYLYQTVANKRFVKGITPTKFEH
jgi:transcriptional regulator with XRE-family HTH domain